MARRRHYLKEWRAFRGVTQEWLAEQIGRDRTYVNKIERGVKRYDQKFLEAAGEALKCSPADLISRDPTIPPPQRHIWELLDRIPEEDHGKVAHILEAFTKKTGTK